MSATHTPGPWRIKVDDWNSQYIYGYDTQAGCEIYIADVSFSWNSAPANARLIAAAPEFLEALEGIASATCEKWEMPYADFKEQFMPWARNVALRVIAKAKKETK